MHLWDPVLLGSSFHVSKGITDQTVLRLRSQQLTMEQPCRLSLSIKWALSAQDLAVHLWDPVLPRSSIHVNKGVITSGTGRVSFHLASPGPDLQPDRVRCSMQL